MSLRRTNRPKRSIIESVAEQPTSPEQAGEPAYLDPRIGVRIRRANRAQLIWGVIDLESLLPAEHPARAIWAMVERLDLSAFYAQIEARDRTAGAPAIDPKILLSLWIYATSEGEGSAREVERRCEMHTAYRWICGGVSVNYHTLSDFRSGERELFDGLVTQVLTVLMKAELLDLSCTTQDGVRVRASAGAGSFRREETLEALMEQASKHLDEVTRAAEASGGDARRRSAEKRAAQDRLERIEAALAEIPKVAETKKRSGAKDTTPRASTTDAAARVMKMGDGGFRPAYNVQIATTADKARAIVGFSVTNRGSDKGESIAMIEQVETRTGQRPKAHLVDGGYASHPEIDAAAAKGIIMYAPLPKPREGDTRDPHLPREDDSEAVAAWRQRMGTEEAKERYKLRAATAETVNAEMVHHRGLSQMPVRGLEKALSAVSLFALTYNVLRAIALGV